MIDEPLLDSEERKKSERKLREQLAAEPRRADLWVALARLLSDSEEDSDRKSAESCWQRAKLIVPTIQTDELVTAQSAHSQNSFSPVAEVATLREPDRTLASPATNLKTNLEHGQERPTLEHVDSGLLDGFFAESSATDRSSFESLFQFPFACRPIVITGGEFCDTEKLFRLLTGHARIIPLDVASKTPEEIHSALHTSEAEHRVLIHAPAWEYRLESLANWPGATVVWLDRDADDRIAEMTDSQLVLERFGPWGVVRPWSVHPDGGPLAFERCLIQFEATGNAIPSTLQRSWQRLQSTRPFRRSLDQAKWLAPEYCRMLTHFWQVGSTETSIRVTTTELTRNSEATIRRILTFANLPADEAHLLDNAAAKETAPQTANRARATSPW